MSIPGRKRKHLTYIKSCSTYVRQHLFKISGSLPDLHIPLKKMSTIWYTNRSIVDLLPEQHRRHRSIVGSPHGQHRRHRPIVSLLPELNGRHTSIVDLPPRQHRRHISTVGSPPVQQKRHTGAA